MRNNPMNAGFYGKTERTMEGQCRRLAAEKAWMKIRL